MNKKFLLLIGTSSLLIGCTTNRTIITDNSYRYNDTQPTSTTTVHNHHYAPTVPKKSVQQEDEELLYRAPSVLPDPPVSRPLPSAVVDYEQARHLYPRPSAYFAATSTYTPASYNVRPFNVVDRQPPPYSRHVRSRCY